jgi:hypothetical protein
MPAASTTFGVGRGLAHAWAQLPYHPRGSRIFDHVGGKHAAFVNAPKWQARGRDFAMANVEASDQYANAGVLPAIASASKLSIFVAGRAGVNQTWHAGCADSNGNRICLSMIFGDFYTIFENGGAYSPSGAAPVGNFTAGVTWDGTQAVNEKKVRAWVRGREITINHAGAGQTNTVTTATPGNWYFGKYNAASLSGTGDYLACYVWRGVAFGGAEYMQLHMNPFLPFSQMEDPGFAVESSASSSIAKFLYHYQQQGAA